MAQTVLGSYPSYIYLSDQIGSRRFEIEPNAWFYLTAPLQWGANRYFLDTMRRAGDQFVCSSDPRLARPGSGFFRELHYLRVNGVRVGATRTPVGSMWMWI